MFKDSHKNQEGRYALPALDDRIRKKSANRNIVNNQPGLLQMKG